MGLVSSTINPGNFMIFHPPDIKSNTFIHNKTIISNGIEIPLYHHEYFKSKKNAKCVIYSHGNSSDLQHLKSCIIQYMRMKIDMIFYDYQGYGYSSRNGNVYPGEYVCVQNLNDIVKYALDKGYQEKNITLWGRSLGTGVTMKYIQNNPDFKGKAIMMCPFTSILDVSGKMAKQYLSIINIFNSEEIVKTSTVPIFFIHSHEDNLVPISHSQIMYKDHAAIMTKYGKNIKKPLWVKRGCHNTFDEVYGLDKMLDQIKHFCADDKYI